MEVAKRASRSTWLPSKARALSSVENCKAGDISVIFFHGTVNRSLLSLHSIFPNTL